MKLGELKERCDVAAKCFPPGDFKTCVVSLHYAMLTEIERLQILCGEASYPLSTPPSRETSDWCPTCGQGWDCSKSDQKARATVNRMTEALERIGSILATVPALELDPEDESNLANSQQALFEIAIIREHALSV